MDDRYTDLIRMLDDRYVMKDACSTRHEKLDDKVDGIKLSQERIITKMDISSKIEWAILVACIGAVIAAIMNLILK